MIVAEAKGVDEIMASLGLSSTRVLVAGCNGCTAVCHVGGEKEAVLMASALRVGARVADRRLVVSEYTVTRQCEPEFIEELRDAIEGRVASSSRNLIPAHTTAHYARGSGEPVDVVVSVACGVGVQMIAEHYPSLRVVPGVDTTFCGTTVEHGVWEERCQGCGACILGETYGLCPVARCAKSLLNGPCGGSQKGYCEVRDSDGKRTIPCIWDMIVRRVMDAGELKGWAERLARAKDWSTARDGGQRRRVRPDLMLPEGEEESEPAAVADEPARVADEPTSAATAEGGERS